MVQDNNYKRYLGKRAVQVEEEEQSFVERLPGIRHLQNIVDGGDDVVNPGRGTAPGGGHYKPQKDIEYGNEPRQHSTSSNIFVKGYQSARGAIRNLFDRDDDTIIRAPDNHHRVHVGGRQVDMPHHASPARDDHHEIANEHRGFFSNLREKFNKGRVHDADDHDTPTVRAHSPSRMMGKSPY